MRPLRLGRYELLHHLASGGMARVYIARVTGPGGFARHVVIKTIPEERNEDQAFIAMFLDEARLVATLHHQHIAQVFEVGRADNGTYFLAMEYVHGETVRHVLEVATKRRKQLPVDLGLSVTCAAAAGLHHAHERRDLDGSPLGIVHRDVSPSNVILGFDGSIKLIDFGIAKARTRSTQTETGHVKGKLGYMAPEQARGEPVDRRSDVFALGVLAYELTTQTRAFHSPSQFETMRRTFHGEVEPPTDPADRFQDADAMRFALEQIARELGATLGDAPVIRALERLFPPRPEPWFTEADGDDDDDTTATASTSEPVIVIAPTTPTKVRLARGTADPSPPDEAASEFEQLQAELMAIQDPLPAPDPRELTTEPFERDARRPVDPAIAAAVTAPISMRARARRAASNVVEAAPAAVPEPAPVPAALLPNPALPLPPPPAPGTGALPLPPGPRAPTASPTVAVTIEPPLGRALARPSDRSIARPGDRPIDLPIETSSPPPLPSVAPALPPRTVAAALPAIAAVARRRFDATDHLGEPKRYRRFAVGAAIVSAALGAGTMIYWLRSPSPPAARVAAPEPPAPPPMRHPAKPTVRKPAPSPPNTERPAPRTTVMLNVTTEPAGATVVLDGVRLGVAPYSAPVASKPKGAWLKVRKRHYIAVKIRVSLDSDVRWNVTLRPLSHQPGVGHE
jgi:serine/threonine protein kinase